MFFSVRPQLEKERKAGWLLVALGNQRFKNSNHPGHATTISILRPSNAVASAIYGLMWLDLGAAAMAARWSFASWHRSPVKAEVRPLI